MNIKNFLSELQHFKQLNIIGPMFEQTLCRPKESFPIILVDGGADLVARNNYPLSISVGDGDSAKSKMDIGLNANKDFTDLNYCLGLIPDHIEEIFFWGFSGGRRDHDLINIGEIYHFLKKQSHSTRIFLDESIQGFTCGSYDLQLEGLFSIVNMEASKLKVTGQCDYQLKEETSVSPLTGLTLSNQAHGEVSIVCNLPFFIFQE